MGFQPLAKCRQPRQRLSRRHRRRRDAGCHLIIGLRGPTTAKAKLAIVDSLASGAYKRLVPLNEEMGQTDQRHDWKDQGAKVHTRLYLKYISRQQSRTGHVPLVSLVKSAGTLYRTI